MMEDFKSGKLKCLIGVDKILGEGVDLPIAKVLIMAGGGKSKIQVMQNVGRVLRLYPDKDKALIYDFADNGGRWIQAHSELREEIYSEY
jgi:superfamily II DNA or RNA helicase